MKNNTTENKFYRFYLIGFFLVLALPLLVAAPWFYPVDWGKTIVFRSIISLLIFLFIYQILFKKGGLILPDIKNKIVWVLVAFFAIVLLSTLFSADINFSLWGSPHRAGGAVNLVFYIAFAILAFLIIKDDDWKKILNFSIFIGVLVCFIALIQFHSLFSNIFIPVPGRPPATMGNSIMLGIYLVLLFFITLSLAIDEKRKNYKIFYCLALLLFAYVILITNSRAAYIGLTIGGLYFILTYPKKLLTLKIITIICLFLGILAVYYINSADRLPGFLENNNFLKPIVSRLSIKLALAEPRFSAWQVAIKAIKEKPVFGWGVENQSIGFDKYYDPSLPYISKQWGGWWDRVHNILLDIGIQSGILAIIIYLLLLGMLFCQLRKLKHKTEHRETQILAQGMLATLLAYFIANIFSFDAFSSYLLFFLLVGYSLHLISGHQASPATVSEKILKYKKIIFVALLALLVFFLWNYNLKPFQINGQIQKADYMANEKKCDKAFAVMEKILPQHSFLDAYLRIKYVEYIKICAGFYPEKNLELAKKGMELMKGAVKMRPLYPRLWIFMGSFTTIKANSEQNPNTKAGLIAEANSYFEKAEQLAPMHQETFIERAKTDMVSKNYPAMREKAEKCIAMDPSLDECYWIRALSEIYLKNFDNFEKYIQMTGRFDINSVSSLHQLVNAYATTENYKELAIVYEKLTKIRPETAQYHSSLAFTYYKLGDYKKAREQAMEFLQLMPQEKEEVETFLRTLPY